MDTESARSLTRVCINCQAAYAAGKMAGGDELFEEICKGYESKAARICGGILRSARIFDSTDDAVQESLLAILGQIRQGKFDGTHSFEPWANTITRRSAFDVGRMQKRRTVVLELMRDKAFGAIDEEYRCDIEVADEFNRIAGLLPEDEMRLLIRRYCDGSSLTDIALEYETTSGAIRARIYRIREHLREVLGISAVSNLNERVKP